MSSLPPTPLLPLQRAALDGIERLIAPSTSAPLRARLASVVQRLDTAQLESALRVLEESEDLEDRTVRDVLGRDGQRVPIHHYRACRAEDAESSWNFRAPNPTARRLRDALMDSLLGPGGVTIHGASALAHAAHEGSRFLFISNHESVFDLAVLPVALQQLGLQAISERLTIFVNPKIFNIPLTNFFICKPVGIIKVPQSPRIAANESVMAADEILRRARHGFQAAGERLASGDSLAIYPEGLRSEGELHRFARAYLDLIRPESLRRSGLSDRDVRLVPWAHRGVRGLEALSDTASPVSVRFGEPIEPTRFFATVGEHSAGVAGHLAGFMVARLLPPAQRGLYGDDPTVFLDHPHFRLRVKPHTLAEVAIARQLAEQLGEKL